MDEHEAILRLKRSDISGLSFLVAQFQVRAVRAAYLITHDRALAEDVVQAAFLALYRNIQTFDTKRPFAPWFMRTVANAAIQVARRQQHEISLDDDRDGETAWADLLTDFATSMDDGIVAAETRQAVWGALQKLSPEQRAAVVMRYYLDLSESEMVAALDVPAGTIKWRLYTARNQLRVLLHHIFQTARG